MSEGEFYYVITRSEDGDVSVRRYTKLALEANLNSEDWQGTAWQSKFESDPEQWSGDHAGIIIRGTFVMPEPVTRVTKLEVP